MEIKLHKLATTTPATRKYIQTSNKSAPTLSRELGVSLPTIYKWLRAGRIYDGSHTRHNLNPSTSPQHEEIIIELRQRLRLSLDDVVEVMNRCFPQTFSRSAIHRCFKRLGVNRLPQVRQSRDFGCFEQATCGFIHMDFKVLSKLKKQRSYVLVAIDRATRFVWVKIIARRDAATTATCLREFLDAFPHPVHTLLTDNDGGFTDRFAVDKKGKPDGKPSGTHPFDRVCREHHIEHRLIRPFRPQTNGMVERFNRRLSEALRSQPQLKSNWSKNRFHNHEQRNQFIHTFVNNYNRTRLTCLGYKSPSEVLSDHTGCNTQRERGMLLVADTVNPSPRCFVPYDRIYSLSIQSGIQYVQRRLQSGD